MDNAKRHLRYRTFPAPRPYFCLHHTQAASVCKVIFLLLTLFSALACIGLWLPSPAFATEMDAMPQHTALKNKAPALEWNITWRTAHKGIEYGIIEAEGSSSSVAVIRINPDYCDFSLHMASEQGTSLSLANWATKEQLLVAINASMYLPDKKTSIGHLRSPTHTNNPRIGKELGAFFVSSPHNTPDASLLPRATILEKTSSGLPDLHDLYVQLEHYGICVQNYRLISKNGSILWKEKQEIHSITAIGEDTDGNIMFFMAKIPMTVATFARTLQNALPGLGSVMYVEGGSKAAMYLNTPEKEMLWHGLRDPWAIFTPEDNLLPNILGVKLRQN